MRVKVKEENILLNVETRLSNSESLLVELEAPLAVVITRKENKNLYDLTKCVGRDKENYYYFFQAALHVGQNHGRGFFINKQYCSLHLKGSAVMDPKTAPAQLQDLPVFPRDLLKQKEENKDDQPDDLAQEYLSEYTFKRYNNTFYYFNPELQKWIELNIKDYDTFNIMLSMKTKKYSQRFKRAIMDSLIPYLYDPKYVEVIEELDSNLLLFKNKRVLDLNTMTSRPFSADDFIFHTIDANWYDDDSEEYKKLKPNAFLEALLKGVSGVRKDDTTDVWAPQRYEDLLSYIGYTLTNERKEASTLIMFGTGRNGKTTLARLIYDLKASSFSMELQTFLNDTHYSAGFYNKRMLFFDELQSGAVDERFIGKFKALTGNDVLNIRPMQKEPYDVKTNFVTYITTNALSSEFFKDRALTRRIKVLNATKPAPDWPDTRADFSAGVRQQVNKDWLANYCIRKFASEGFDISKLFIYDMKDWAVRHNAPIRDLLTAWKSSEWADYHGNLNKKHDDLIHLLMTASGGIKQMASGRSLNIEPSTPYFDEQMNLFMINLLNLKSVRVEGGYVRYDGDSSKLKASAAMGDYRLIGIDQDKKLQDFILIFENDVEKVHWRINMRQEINIKYVLETIFGWNETVDGSDWSKTLVEHITKGTRFKLENINGSIVIYKPVRDTGRRIEGYLDVDDSEIAYEEVYKQIKKIAPQSVNERRAILNANTVLLDNDHIMKLLKMINIDYAIYESNLNEDETE